MNEAEEFVCCGCCFAHQKLMCHGYLQLEIAREKMSWQLFLFDWGCSIVFKNYQCFGSFYHTMFGR